MSYSLSPSAYVWDLNLRVIFALSLYQCHLDVLHRINYVPIIHPETNYFCDNGSRFSRCDVKV